MNTIIVNQSLWLNPVTETKYRDTAKNYQFFWSYSLSKLPENGLFQRFSGGFLQIFCIDPFLDARELYYIFRGVIRTQSNIYDKAFLWR